MSEAGKKTRGRVWDPLVRLFHWSLVAAFATAWFIRSEAAIHETAGKTVLVLVILRAAWGIIGPGSARFETFIKGPITTLRYVISILRGKPAHYPGHNPAGAAMIGALLLSLTATTVSGVLMTTTAFWGGEWIEWIHGTSARLTVLLIAGHLLGVIAACLQHRENLPWSMVTGRKWVSVNTERFLGPTMFTRRRSLAALAVIATGLGVWSASSAALNAGFWRLPRIIAAEATKGGCEVETVSGPRIVIYPSMQVQYDVTYAEEAGGGLAAVPAGIALQKRPKVDVANLVQDCQIAFEAKSSSSFGFANGLISSFMSTVESVRSAAANADTGQQAATAPQSAEPAALAVIPGAVRVVLPPFAGDSDAVPDNSVSTAAPAQDNAEAVRPAKLTPAPKAPDAKAVVIKKAAPVRAKPVKPVVRKQIKKKAVAAKSVSKKAVRKIAKRKKYAARRTLSGISSGSSGSGSSNSGSGSSNSGSGSSNSGSGSGNSGSGSSNSGSGSGNSGSGSSNSGSGSSGGGDDD